MTAHEPFLELAAAAIDFPLSAVERASLAAHLSGCPACRGTVEAMRADAAAIGALPAARLAPARGEAILGSVLAPSALRPPLRLLLVAALLALLALGSFLVGAELLQQRPDDLAVVPPVPSPSGSEVEASRSTVPSPTTPAELGVTWTAPVGAPPLMAVTAGGPGWVAVGSAPPIDDPTSQFYVAAAWTSADGRSWTRSTNVAMPEGSTSGEMTGVAGTGTDLYAIGTADLNAGTIWHSVDGETWEIVGSGSLFDLGPCIEGCASLTSVAAGPAGVVVAGYRVIQAATPGSEWDLWSSQDGTSWRRLPAPLLADLPRASAESVAATASGFIASGTVCDAQGMGCRAVTWTSTDGGSWSAPVELPDGSGVNSTGVASGPGGHVVLGQRCSDAGCRIAVWSSTDGVSWEAATIDGDDTLSSSRRLLVSAGERFVVLGSKGGVVSAWISSDGLEWERQVLPSDTFAPAPATLIFDLAGRPDGIVVVGVVQESGDSKPTGPAVWVSPSGPSQS